MRTEHHPFEPFVPADMEFLIVGSFPGKEQTQSEMLLEQWFYGAPRNLFWRIMEGVYDLELRSQRAKRSLLSSLKIGLTDIILKAERKLDSNLDGNLHVVEWNDKAIAKILHRYPDVKILCTSKFVEKHVKRRFPLHANIWTLPSPSPRYARMSVAEKIEVYKNILPKKKG
ncbi:MAG: uracil-DNA glycosylase family protein [Arachidicoccus sp.]|nr:uracil-DNA glycosylase family protein [Arachidicoccus sp.]